MSLVEKLRFLQREFVSFQSQSERDRREMRQQLHSLQTLQQSAI